MESVNLAHDAALVVLSAVFSCAGTIAVFSARLSVADQKHLALVNQVKNDRTADKELLEQKFSGLSETLDRQERLQRAVLEIVANLARAGGTNQRKHTSDALLGFLTDGE